jgi:acetyltransferase EpsM
MNKEKAIVIVGAGRQAAESYFLLIDIGQKCNIVGFAIDKKEGKEEFFGIKIWEVDELINEYINKENKPEILVAIGTIKDNKKLTGKFKNAEFSFFSAINPQINIDRQKFIGKGVTIAQGTILTCNVSVGNHAIINIGCLISHDCVIGDHVNISPGCNLAGNVKLEDDVFVGVGASFIPNVTIGKGSIIAAASCVTKDVPPYTLVAGVPAVIKKQFTG